MARIRAKLDVSILARPSGMIAVAGSVAGTVLGVITLFVVLYTDVPGWAPAWVAACGASLVASSVWAWLRPEEVAKARQVGIATAIAAVGSSAPAMRMWIQVGQGDLGRVEVAVVGVALGLACACYLAFAAADLVRDAALEAMAHPAR